MTASFAPPPLDAATTPAAQPLLKSGALHDAIFNSANFSCIATDARGVIQIFNVGAERMLGYRAAEVIDRNTPVDLSDGQELIARAKSLSAELATPIAPGFEAMVYKAARGIEDIDALTLIRKDGSRFPALVSVTALRDSQDGIIGYLLIGTDNTERIKIEAQRELLNQQLRQQQERLQETNLELDQARLAAEKANQAKSEFLSSMSHELRTPLNAVLGFAQLMESATPLPTPAQKLSIEQILKGGWYLLHLINEILDLATIESGKMTMAHEAVPLAAVLQDCHEMIMPQASTRKITLHFPAASALPSVMGDATRIKQVLINLLSNAIKYNRPDGSVSVRVGITERHQVRVSVTDTGAGLSEHQLTELFQPFNRLGQADGGEEGTGIGLVVTKQLTELMGGRVGVSSELGTGSEFWVELASAGDATQIAPIAETAAPTEVDPVQASHASPRTLLYVEDNPANLALVEQLIARRSDMRLLTAVDAQIGIALARSQLPEVILMDLNLPGLSGRDALAILRHDPLTAHIPVLALTANAIPRDIERGLSAGFFRYLTKPIKFTEFMEALDIAFAHASANPPIA